MLLSVTRTRYQSPQLPPNRLKYPKQDENLKQSKFNLLTKN